MYMTQEIHLKRLNNDSGVMILGLFSIFFCCFFGIPGLACGMAAILMGNRARQESKLNPSEYDPESISQVNTGWICGIIGSILSLLVIIYFIISILIAFSNPELFKKIQEMQNL